MEPFYKISVVEWIKDQCFHDGENCDYCSVIATEFGCTSGLATAAPSVIGFTAIDVFFGSLGGMAKVVKSGHHLAILARDKVQHVRLERRRSFGTFDGPSRLSSQISAYPLKLVGPRRDPAQATDEWILCRSAEPYFVGRVALNEENSVRAQSLP